MNAVSVTMVKRMDAGPLQGYAFRLTVAMIMLSWAGWQALLISGADQMQGYTTHALLFLETGLILLFYSLLSFLRLKRKEALPARESVQLFFGGLLVGLPVLTWLVWWQIKQMLTGHQQHRAENASSACLLYACIMISVAYVVMMLVWLQTSVSSYESASPGSWPNRTMHWLRSSVIDPYFK